MYVSGYESMQREIVEDHQRYDFQEQIGNGNTPPSSPREMGLAPPGFQAGPAAGTEPFYNIKKGLRGFRVGFQSGGVVDPYRRVGRSRILLGISSGVCFPIRSWTLRGLSQTSEGYSL